MTMGADIGPFDCDAFKEGIAKEQRELLALARRQPKPDEAAAHQLLLWFARFGEMADPLVHEAILDGMREVAAHVVNQSILQKNGEAPQVHALMFFNGSDAPGKRGRKNQMAKRLALIAAHGDPSVPGSLRGVPLLSLAELKEALTTRIGRALPRRDWPKQMHRVEERLIEYVARKHGLEGGRSDECRWYVHASFDLDWTDREAPFPYPKKWG